MVLNFSTTTGAEVLCTQEILIVPLQEIVVRIHFLVGKGLEVLDLSHNLVPATTALLIVVVGRNGHNVRRVNGHDHEMFDS